MNALRGITWRYAVIALLAVAAVVVGLLRPQLISTAFGAKRKLSATDRVKQGPPPPLFAGAEITLLGDLLGDYELAVSGH
ncbi:MULTISPECIES: hypothetical protein [Streptomyces]|uniref:Uncharacterized protein n=2 Tax=Streptomyces TaxID=1883 RepID=A0A2N8PI47_STRNR|nr:MULTISPECIES: hypothetical protein [Streptomyces]PNE40724.1 hypothetical protein AOB60_07775 [Streptomyces noursei]SHM70615.1 hypothetical protein SAMN05216268_113132 [Streptomyces yunnanensis]